MTQPRSSLNIVLWMLQVLWGVFFGITGVGKLLCYDPAVWQQTLHQVAWFSAVPQGLFVFIGACEFLGGIGLILPAMTRVRPELTPYAGLGLAVVMALAAGFHIVRGEYNFLPINVMLGGVAAFIGYGRFAARPIAPAPLNAVRVVQALAVAGAVVVLGAAPILYRLRHVR